MRKNTVVIKEKDEWSGLADFLGNMIAKYAEVIDFASLPDPDSYLRKRRMHTFYRRYKKEYGKWKKVKKMVLWNYVICSNSYRCNYEIHKNEIGNKETRNAV